MKPRNLAALLLFSLPIAACALPVEIQIEYEATDPLFGTSEELRLESGLLRTRSVRQMCALQLTVRDVEHLNELFEEVVTDDVPTEVSPADCPACTQFSLSAVQRTGYDEEVLTTWWRGEMDPVLAGEPLTRFVGELDRLWEHVQVAGDCEAAAF